MLITYKGKNPPVLSSLKVEDEDITADQFQLWHSTQFVQAITGIELIYPYEDVMIENLCIEPFKPLSNKYYQLDLEETIATQSGHALLIMPHYRYYSDWSIPLPVACSWNTDWWPKPLSIIFRYGHCPTIFRKGEPYAQALSVKKCDYKILPMEEREDKQKTSAREYIDKNADKYITRKWVMSNGTVQDNLYDVLSKLDKYDKLPPELLDKQKKLKVIT